MALKNSSYASSNPESLIISYSVFGFAGAIFSLLLPTIIRKVNFFQEEGFCLLSFLLLDFLLVQPILHYQFFTFFVLSIFLILSCIFFIVFPILRILLRILSVLFSIFACIFLGIFTIFFVIFSYFYGMFTCILLGTFISCSLFVDWLIFVGFGVIFLGLLFFACFLFGRHRWWFSYINFINLTKNHSNKHKNSQEYYQSNGSHETDPHYKALCAIFRYCCLNCTWA